MHFAQPPWDGSLKVGQTKIKGVVYKMQSTYSHYAFSLGR